MITYNNKNNNIALGYEQPDKSLVHEVQILYKLLPTTQWMDIAAVALVFGLLIRYVDIASLLLWSLFVIVIISVRISISERYHATSVTTENVQTWYNWFLVGVTLYGAMWSGTAVLIVPSEIPTAATFTALILCGLTAAGVAVSSVNLKAFTLYTLATLWPYSFYLIASQERPQTAIGTLMFLFSFVVFIMGMRTYHFFSNMVNLELKSDKLEQELKQEIRKRNFAENALLDNTLEEELAEKIRQQSLALKDGKVRVGTGIEYIEPDYSRYLELLNNNIRNQLRNTLVLVRDLEEANLPENHKKDVRIIDKIISNIISSIKKSIPDEEHVRQEILEIEMDDESRQPMNIRRIVNYLVQGIPIVYKAKYITVNRNIGKDVPATVYGNKRILSKILSNLIINAVKYSDGGNVEIIIRTTSQTPDNIELSFTVADTGVGMPRDAVDFMKREDSEHVELYPGLAVVKHLVGKYGSNLAVKTTLSVGTEISFQMPFVTERLVTA